MKRFYFVFLLTVFIVGLLRGYVYGDSVSLTANTIRMAKSTTYNININGKRPGFTYNWVTSDNNIVSVNSKNGVIKAVNAGEATISCRITGSKGELITLTSNVIVGDESSVPRLRNTRLDLKVGEHFDINIAGKIKSSKYHWKSSDPAVVRVNASNGYVTALSKGEAKVTCTITAPNKQIIVLLATVHVAESSSNIIWEEHFNGSALDSRKWGHEYGYVRNFELQNYTDSSENVFLKDGYLVLKARKDRNGAWTSASIHTNNRLEIGNARVEARIKLPYESGAFPAFWLLGADYEVDYNSQRTRGDSWLEAREIDIMETFGKVNRVQGGVFIKEYPTATALSQYAAKSQEIDITQFHTYAVEKSDTAIKFYCDNILYYTVPITDEGLREPFYIILNLAVGAAGGTPDPAITEMEMLVDYVKVTALEGDVVTEPEAITLEMEEFYGRVGDVKKINAQIMPLDAQDRTITWVSSDPSIATVDGGYVRLRKAGTCIISATTANGVTKTCKIIIT